MTKHKVFFSDVVTPHPLMLHVGRLSSFLSPTALSSEFKNREIHFDKSGSSKSERKQKKQKMRQALNRASIALGMKGQALDK